MPLIKSISGLRGTIGGSAENNLTPSNIVRFVTAYARFIAAGKNRISESPAPSGTPRLKVVVGRDARISGEMVRNLAVGALCAEGFDIIDLGLAATPTVELAVPRQQAAGGLIITASHNPQGWNALKFLNKDGEFLTAAEGEEILRLADSHDGLSADEEGLGRVIFDQSALDYHLQKILALPLVNNERLARRQPKIVVDGINSVGGLAVPELLTRLGLREIINLNCEPTGRFAHAPEPLEKNLESLREAVRVNRADLGIVVDPDVDRLAFIDEKGAMFGEEYTLVAVADYILTNHHSGSYRKIAVSNLSSSRALADIARRRGGDYLAAPVGEVNVVAQMKEARAVIGGEGNGGIIYPELHYGRDALVGIALFLSAWLFADQPLSGFRRKFPDYFMVKDKIDLKPGLNWNELLKRLKEDYRDERCDSRDGLKIDRPNSWVHLRPSNTEPIIRIYAEGLTAPEAQREAEEVKSKILSYIS